MSPRITIAATLVTLLFSVFADAKIISKENYKYPIIDPDEATVAATGMHTPQSVTEELKISVKGRKLQGFHDHRDLEAKFYPSPWPTKQLVFVISGIGGDTKSGYSTFLAHQTQMRGVDAVIIPNSINQNFIISSSSNGLVGGSAADAADLYEVLVRIKKTLAAKGRHYDEIKLVGYSHGALLAAFLEASDKRAMFAGSSDAVNFHSALLINPPIDLLHGIRTIDKRTKATKQIGLKRLIKLALRFRKAIGRFTKILTTPESHVEFSKSLKMASDERYALIGKALTVSLPGAIVASQAVDDLGILPEIYEDAFYESMRERRSAAKRYSYEDYVLKFFSAHAIKSKTSAFSMERLNQENSLTALLDVLQNNKTIFLMHNMDDLLLTKGQGHWLESVFGKRALIYPTGGHLGNMWYPDNLQAYYRFLYYGKF